MVVLWGLADDMEDGMSADDQGRALPSLGELLERRGIYKSEQFGDYQDYIEDQQREGCDAQLVKLPRIYSQGSMHLALGRIQSVKEFWSRSDKA